MKVEIGNLFGITFKREVFHEIDDEPNPMAPEVDASHVFDASQVKILLSWLSGVFKPLNNLLLVGPTGTGKSSMVEQFCARLNLPLYRVACHGRMEFPELVGGYSIKGEWVPGPLVTAMKNGGILLLDEFNFLPPAAVGGMNTVLDGGALLIPETGEVVKPATGFRIAATANDVAGESRDYRGTQKQNIALVDRFITIKVDYLDKVHETGVIANATGVVDNAQLEVMMNLAGDVREAYKKGEVGVTFSTRKLIAWGRMSKVLGDLGASLEATLLGAAAIHDRQVIAALYQRHTGEEFEF